MNDRNECLRLIEKWQLGPEEAARLRTLARMGQPVPEASGQLGKLTLALGALLFGGGAVFFVAANWDDLSRVERFALAQGAVVVAAVLAALVERARSAALLFGFLATGALLALIGQTYQTGADPWQLFALWSVVAFPWVFASRSDLLRVPLVLVLSTAIWLWQQAHGGWRFWGGNDQWSVLLLASAAHLAVLVALTAWARLTAQTDRFRWCLRAACCAWLAHLGHVGLRGLWEGSGWLWPVAIAAAVGAAIALYRARPFDVLTLSAAALLIDALLVFGLVRLLIRNNHASSFLLISVVALGIVGGTVVVLMRAIRSAQAQASEESTP
jgi:uncharacterized membrane protein